MKIHVSNARADLLHSPSQPGFGPPPPRPPPAVVPPVAAPAPVPVQQYNQTKTIRNMCNINKKSLRLVPVPGDPLKLQITFLFDCTDDCLCVAYGPNRMGGGHNNSVGGGGGGSNGCMRGSREFIGCNRLATATP